MEEIESGFLIVDGKNTKKKRQRKGKFSRGNSRKREQINNQ